MSKGRKYRWVLWCLGLIACPANWTLAQVVVPDGFHDELVLDDFLAPVAVAFPDTHLIYLSEQNGLIHVLKNGHRLSTPLLDIQAEVSAAGDHGMLGMVLDPSFLQNGYIYVSYVVDPHYLMYYGSPEYDATLTDSWNATIGRVTRYQINVADLTSLIPGSRKVLLGTDVSNGIPVLAPAHGIGGLDFGTDGTLLVGAGDGTTWVGHFTGGEDYKEFGYDSLGKVLGILIPEQDVGSFRAQQVESYNGKVLRIDPATGLGLPSNPFYDSRAPDAAQSKVWALGLRSPFRIRVRPGSGATDPSDGRPGIIYIGDVGSNQFEELNIAGEPGRNFGWPLYEGMELNEGFYDQWIINPYARNSQRKSGCDLSYYRFNDLLVPPRKDHRLVEEHPCDPGLSIQKDHPVFVHERPAFAYGNTKNNPEQTFVPIFSTEGVADHVSINHPLSPTVAIPFDGISSVAGDFYLGPSFPKPYQHTYFHADFSGWIKSMTFDSHNIDEIHAIRSFKEGGYYVVYIKWNPFDDALYYVVLDYSSRPNIYQLRKISYGGNAKPTAVIEVDTSYGASPLEVHVTAIHSFDPAGEPLSYQWSFNGLKSNVIDTTLVLEAPNNSPVNYGMRLTVQDTFGHIDSVDKVISLNNTPPQVNITSVEDGYHYPLDQGLFDVLMEADVGDAEHELASLSYHWEIKLKHNDHFHIEFLDTNATSSISLFPLGNSQFDQHSYVVSLTVTDPLGLSSYDAITITPDLSTPTASSERQFGIHVYPNPTTNLITLESDECNLQNLQVECLNIFGQSEKVKLINNDPTEARLNLQHLPGGLYILLMKESGKVMGTAKIIKK